MMKLLFINPIRYILLILFMSISCLVSAEWIQVTGKASLSHGRYDLAREQAMKDALRQAVYQYGMNVDSQQTLENGQLKKDTLNLASRAQVKQSVIHAEKEEDGYFSHNARTLKLNMNDEFIVDGELFRSCSQHEPLRITASEPITFLVP